MDLLSKAGGLLSGLYRGMLISALFLCKLTVDTKLIGIILKPYMEKYNQTDMQKNIQGIQQLGF